MTEGDIARRRPKRLSVVFLVPRFHTNLFYAVSALVEAGHRVQIICVGRHSSEDHSVAAPIYVGADASFARISQMLRSLAPDLLFIRDVQGLSRKFFLAALSNGIRAYGYDQHPLYRRRSFRKIVFDLFRGRPIKRITPVLGLNRSRPPDPYAYYLPFPVERTLDWQREYAPGGVVRILCVGKLAQPRKNHCLLIAALAALDASTKFHLTIVGSSKIEIGGGSEEYRDALLREARDGALAGRIRILPDVPFADMPRVYNEHDICVLPSIGEPLGTAPLEAMAYGCVPIISTECGSAGYILDQGCGHIVQAGDVDALREALESLIAEPSAISAMGARAQMVAEKDFSKRRFVERVEQLLPPIENDLA